MEQQGISFFLRLVYDPLPAPVNLTKYKLSNSSKCNMCEEHGTLQHILSACPRTLCQGMYTVTWRHGQVFIVITKDVKKATENVNEDPRKNE